jgi:hypothetical protein
LVPGTSHTRSALTIFGIFAAGWILTAIFAGSGSGRSEESGPQTPRTQIVVQWLVDDTAADLGLLGIYSLEDTLEDESQNLFEVDGHDFGSGTANVFLYARDPEAAVGNIVRIFRGGKLRPGMRIGVAQYTNPERTDWIYRPAYPPGLDRFEIAY